MARFHDPNAEVEATLHVLSSPLLPQDVVARYFDRDRRYFDANGLLEHRDWSSSEQALIRGAADIWGGTGTIGELIGRVDDEEYRRIVEALALRRGILLGDV